MCLERAFGERLSRFLLVVRDTNAKPHPYEIHIFRQETRDSGCHEFCIRPSVLCALMQ